MIGFATTPPEERSYEYPFWSSTVGSVVDDPGGCNLQSGLQND